MIIGTILGRRWDGAVLGWHYIRATLGRRRTWLTLYLGGTVLGRHRPGLCETVLHSVSTVPTVAGWHYTWSAPSRPLWDGVVLDRRRPDLCGIGIDREAQSEVLTLMLTWL